MYGVKFRLNVSQLVYLTTNEDTYDLEYVLIYLIWFEFTKSTTTNHMLHLKYLSFSISKLLDPYKFFFMLTLNFTP